MYIYMIYNTSSLNLCFNFLCVLSSGLSFDLVSLFHLHTKNLVDLSKMHQSKVVLCAFGDVLSL